MAENLTVETEKRGERHTRSIKTDPVEFDVQWRHIEYIDALKASDKYADDWSSVLAQILDEHGAREEGY